MNIFEAAEAGNFEEVRMLVDKGVALEQSSNRIGYRGWTLLMFAAKSGNLELCKWLVNEKGINVNTKSEFGETVLMSSALSGNIDLCKWFVDEKGMNVNEKDKHGLTALMYAAKEGYFNLCKWLVDEKGADVNATTDCKIGKMTVLKRAARSGNLDLCKWLIDEKGMKADTTILEEAAHSGNPKLCKWLVDEKKVELDKRVADAVLNGASLGLYKWLDDEKGIENADATDCLRIAALSGNLKLCKWLVDEKGADINKPTSAYAVAGHPTSTVLIDAVEGRNLELCKWLVDEKGMDVNEKGIIGGITALMNAAYWGIFDLCKWLVDEEGVNVNEKDKRGQTALMYAACSGHFDLCKWLVDEKGADINAKSNFGETALTEIAKRHGNLDYYKWFCEKMTKDKDTISFRIEKEIDFTSEEYWKDYWKKDDLRGNGASTGWDPDRKSKSLAETHAFLWSGKTGNTQNPDIKLDLNVVGRKNFILNDKKTSILFSSDTLINSFKWKRTKETVLRPLINELGSDKYHEMQEAFTKKAYTIGGMIIFPQRKAENSINRQRGFDTLIADRVDLTIECIRRYFFNETNPCRFLSSSVLEKNGDFFRLFGTGFDGFKAYIDFFFLNDIVSPDYKKVRSFIGTKEFLEQDAFSTSPSYPKNKEKWIQWKENAVDFIDKRNQRILTALRNGTIEKRRA